MDHLALGSDGRQLVEEVRKNCALGGHELEGGVQGLCRLSASFSIVHGDKQQIDESNTVPAAVYWHFVVMTRNESKRC